MAFAILRHGKIKTFVKLRQVGAHNERRRKTPNADPGRSNRILIGSGNAEADVRARLCDVGIDPDRRRKNGVLAVEILLTASAEYFRPGRAHAAGEWDREPTERWLSASLAYLRRQHGDNLVSASAHFDETTVHIHGLFVPVDDTPRRRGAAVRLNAARWFDGPAKLRALQDDYAEAMAPLGLERGLSGSKAKHRDIARQYTALHGDAAAAREAATRASLLLGDAALERRRALVDRQHARSEDARATAFQAGIEAWADGRIIGVVGDARRPAFAFAPMAPAEADALRGRIRPAWREVWGFVGRATAMVEQRTRQAVANALHGAAEHIAAARSVFMRAQALAATLTPTVRAELPGLSAAINKAERSRPARQGVRGR